MKKYLPLLLAIFISMLTFGGLKAFAATGGYFDHLTIKNYYGSPLTLVTDDAATSTNVRNSSGIPWFVFNQPETIDKIWFWGETGITINFYSDQNKTNLIKKAKYSTLVGGSVPTQQWVDIQDVPGVQSITASTDGVAADMMLDDLDFKTVSQTIVHHDEIANISAVSQSTSATLSWTTPTNNAEFTGSKIYRNGTLIKTVAPGVNSYTDSNLTQYSTYSYKVTATYSDGIETSGLTTITTTGISHDEVTSLSVVANAFDSADLTWGVPQSSYLVGFNVYRDNKLIKNLDKTVSTFKDSGLSENTAYNYKVTALYYDGGETSGLTKMVVTPFDPIIKDVLKAQITTISYKQINLSWTLPTQSRFKDIGIYREEKQKDPSLFSYVVSGTTAYAAEPTEIFQTNGTYFNDLTVKPDTSYVYTLKTETTDGSASEGVTLAADTPSEPIPILTQDGKYSTTPTGDYVFKWTTPTIGTVKVLVGGKEYTTVSASTKQIAIPNKDMVNNIWGMPDVYLIPVGEFGTEGKKVYAGGVNSTFGSTLPFNPTDLIESGNGLLWIVAPFVLLALSFLLFPKFRKLIFTAFGKFRPIQRGEEKRDPQERKFRTRIRERHEGKEHLEKMKQQEKKVRSQVKEPRIRDTKQSKIKLEKQPKETKAKAERKVKEKKQSRQPREPKQPRERTKKPREPRAPRGRRGAK